MLCVSFSSPIEKMCSLVKHMFVSRYNSPTLILRRLTEKIAEGKVSIKRDERSALK